MPSRAILLTLTTIISFVKHAYGVDCKWGFNLTNERRNYEGNHTKTCEAGESCIRGEAAYDNSGVKTYISGGSCVASNRCEEPCKTLLKTVILTANDKRLPEEEYLALYPTNRSFYFCEYECCSTDFCNIKSIEELRRPSTTTTITEPPSTDTSNTTQPIVTTVIEESSLNSTISDEDAEVQARHENDWRDSARDAVIGTSMSLFILLLGTIFALSALRMKKHKKEYKASYISEETD